MTVNVFSAGVGGMGRNVLIVPDVKDFARFIHKAAWN